MKRIILECLLTIHFLLALFLPTHILTEYKASPINKPLIVLLITPFGVIVHKKIINNDK